MGTMKDIDVKGRGLVKGRVTVRPTETGLTLEVNDEANPEMWLHVHIDREFLRALMGTIDFKATEDGVFWEEKHYREHKRRVQEPLPDIPPSEPPLPDIPPGWNSG